LDDERFVDLGKDFLQRRRDDPSKRRAVQRNPGTLFSNKTFVLAPDVEKRDDLVAYIAGCEGFFLFLFLFLLNLFKDTWLLKRLHKKVDYLVVSDATPFSSKLVSEAHSLNIPVITAEAMLRAVKEDTFPPSKLVLVDTKKAVLEAARLKKIREEEELKKKNSSPAKRPRADEEEKPKEQFEQEDDDDDEEEILMTKVAKKVLSPVALTVKSASEHKAKSGNIGKAETMIAPPTVMSAAKEESESTPRIEDSIASMFCEGAGQKKIIVVLF
jgi:hypothetical protein